MRLFLPLCCLAAFLCASRLTAQIVVNEIMYYPDPGEPEWVELYNNSDTTATLAGWSIREDSNSTGSPLFSGTIPPHGYLVATTDLEKFTQRWGTVSAEVVEVKFNYLNNNGGDCVRLQDGSDRYVDSVCYKDNWGGRNGRSLERRSPLAPSNDPANWMTSTDPNKGTPDHVNSVAASDVPLHRRPDLPTLLYPNPTSGDVVLGPFDGNRGEVEIHGLDGRVMRKSQSISGGMSRISVADLPAGRYIVLIRVDGTQPVERTLVIAR